MCHINPTGQRTYRYRSDAYMVEPVISGRVTWRDYSKKGNKTFTHEQNKLKDLSHWADPHLTKPFTRHRQDHLWLETLQLKSCSRDLHLNGLVSAWHRKTTNAYVHAPMHWKSMNAWSWGRNYNSDIQRRPHTSATPGLGDLCRKTLHLLYGLWA